MEAKIGQKVLVKNSVGNVVKIGEISQETKTSWRVDDSLYTKGSLTLRGRDTYSSSSIILASEEMLEETREKFRRMNLLRKVRGINIEKLSNEQLMQIVKWESESKGS